VLEALSASSSSESTEKHDRVIRRANAFPLLLKAELSLRAECLLPISGSPSLEQDLPSRAENFLTAIPQVWDLGGQDRLRTSWATYYRGTHAVIIVVDSTDRTRISIVRDELFKLLEHEDLQPAVVLVFANKQDLKDAMSPAEISDALSLHSIKRHDWHIQACCALTGEGLYDGLGWIAQHVTGSKAPTL
jgi:hypothetical protein